MKNVNMIFACDLQYGIGFKNNLPWPFNKEDMKWFRENTNNHVVVMGKNTWESIGSKKLKDRINIVITNSKPKSLPDKIYFGDMNEIILNIQKLYENKKIWIIGGGKIYDQTFDICEKIYMTKFHKIYNCDTFINKQKIFDFNEIEYMDIRNDLTFFIRKKKEKK